MVTVGAASGRRSVDRRRLGRRHRSTLSALGRGCSPARVRRAGSPPAGGRADLTSEFVGHGAHVGGGEVVRIVVYQHISLDRTAEVRPAHRVAHVERLQQRELVRRNPASGCGRPAPRSASCRRRPRRRRRPGSPPGSNGLPSSTNHGVSRMARTGMLLSANVLPDPDVGARHHVAGFDVPRPRRGGEDVVGVVGDQLGHRLAAPSRGTAGRARCCP